MKITIKITELDGNFPDGFLGEKYARELEKTISENVEAEFSFASVSVDVDLVKNCSGVNSEPSVDIIPYGTPDDSANYYRVMEIIEFTRDTFGAECMQDEDFYE